MIMDSIRALFSKHDIMHTEKSVAHWVVEGNKGFIDYWPTTGKWKERNSVVEGFGARLLTQYIVNGLSHDNSE
jgi:hypothetical protein